MNNSAFSHSNNLLTYKALREAVELVAVLTVRQFGLEPDAHHDITTGEYAALVYKATGRIVEQGDRIRLGTAAAMQAKLAGRGPKFREDIITTKRGLKKAILVKVHARDSLHRAAEMIGIGSI